MKVVTLALFLFLNTFLIQAQEYKHKSFLVMSSYGYMHSEFIKGFGAINTLLYSPAKLWAFGIDLGISTGKMSETIPSDNFVRLTTRGNNYFIGPSLYLLPINTKKHQIFAGGGINFTHSYKINLQKESQDSRPNAYWIEEKDDGVGFSFNGGYNYKLTENWFMGARFYLNHYNETYVMGLINIGLAF